MKTGKPMSLIKELFDPGKDIYRAIEKVITYAASQERRLKTEISEYIVTDSIEAQFEKLLRKMQDAMEIGGENEVGVWVSGFYGSGKSSFTKYLGLALDGNVQIDNVPFIKHLQDRLHKAQTKAILSSVSEKFPAAVVLLDLATEMLAGATMEDVSTVLYFKVLQWAGYSRNLKVAAFERKLKTDGRYPEFEEKIQTDLGVSWDSVQNDPLVIDSLIPEIAHQMYPQLFKTTTSFSTETTDFVRFENERVKEMLDIVRETTGKDHIMFIIDEVGQYVGSRKNMMLNLDGLAKNLKEIGNGKAWIVGTAQQTLTEDDPRAALNSPELFKLKDRFPIQIDLESSDIREICYKRLLGKSPAGESILGKLFEKHGQELRYNTKLQDAKYYDSDFDQKVFTNLYPFLPAHFDILLHLLGALAKSTGGIGLRSAIKVIQDILIEGTDGKSPVAESEIGWLATTITLYDALEKDIRRAFPSIHGAVEKADIPLRNYDNPVICLEIAKTVAVLQILGNLPVSVQNVSGLMHPSVAASSRSKEIEDIVNKMISDPKIPFGEQDGNLCFFSEKLNDIEQERAQIPLRTVETKRIYHEVLKDVFSPLPSVRLDGTLTVTSGVRSQSGSFITSLSGERETVQTIVERVDTSEYETTKSKMVEESRHRSSQAHVYLLGRTSTNIEDKISEIYRCREICQRYRNEPDQEVKEYCKAQSDRALKLTEDLQRLLKETLTKGSFVFRGQATAVDSLEQELLEACKKHLVDVAKQVFDRYSEAPIRAATDLAEKFLRAYPKAITSKIDPLNLVKTEGGTTMPDLGHKALTSIRDYIERNGMVEGKRLIEHFTNAPFGWSPDTLRYLMSVLFVAGELKLKISGKEVTALGQQAIDALKTNNAFKPIGVALREERPSIEVCAKAAERLTDLTGESIAPLEPEISEHANNHFYKLRFKLSPLEGTLTHLGLPGVNRLQSLNDEIADILITDASDVPQRLGAEESALYENNKWAEAVFKAFENGLDKTIQELQKHRQDILGLPDSGIPGKLRTELLETLESDYNKLAKEDFFQHDADLNSLLTSIQTITRETAQEMAESQLSTIREAEEEIIQLSQWQELTQEEQSSVLAQLDGLRIKPNADLAGLKALINQEFVIHNTLADVRKRIVTTGKDRAEKKIKVKEKQATEENIFLKEVSIPYKISSLEKLNATIESFEDLRVKALKYDKIDLTFKLDKSSE